MSNYKKTYYAQIINEQDNKNKKEKNTKKDRTIPQFQSNHCRYCKNKKTNLCEIRRNIDNNYCCEYEENIYERRNIK